VPTSAARPTQLEPEARQNSGHVRVASFVDARAHRRHVTRRNK